MLLNRVPIRANVFVTTVAMGALALGTAVVAGRIYRDHAIENERAAIEERLRIGAAAMRRSLNREAEAAVRRLTDPSLPSAAPAKPRRESPANAIDKLWAYYASSELGLALAEVALYDQNLQLLGRRTATPVAREWQSACDYVRAQKGGSDPAPEGAVFGYCVANGRLYHSAFVRVPHYGWYAQLTAHAVPSAQAVETLIGLPVRLVLSDGAAIYESPRWPSRAAAPTLQPVSLPLDVPGGRVLLFQAAKDESALYARLEQTRYAVLFAAAAVTLLFMLGAVALLEWTVVSPMRRLAEQLRGMLRDESQLGGRLSARGNTEVVQLADGFNAMTQKLEGLYSQLEHMAYTDTLTQLPNRTFFYNGLEQAIAQAQRENRTFALFIMDLNRFKEINDTLGHHVGDVLLQQVAIRLREKLRETDTIARLGGDEFAVLLPTVTAKQADMAARMLLQSLRSPFIVEAHHLDVGTSIGVALYPDHGVDAHTLVQRADVAMYAAKQAGSGHMFYDPEMDRNSPAQLTLMAELRQAVEQEQFELYYQPKIGLKANRVVGIEALVRWRHPSGKLIMPEAFIPLLEQTGLIRGLTGWVTHEALRMGGELRGHGFDLPIAVNISARDLQNTGLAEELAEHVAVHQAAANWLELEITESAVMSDVAGAQDLLTRLAGMGFKIVIDDFGTGYSSLAYLKRLPVHAVKIDKSFVMGMAKDENDAAIVYTSIDLTHNLGLQVVAEGVDDEGVLVRLRSRGCDAVQGMFLSRPLSSEELGDWLTKSVWGMPAKVAC